MRDANPHSIGQGPWQIASSAANFNVLSYQGKFHPKLQFKSRTGINELHASLRIRRLQMQVPRYDANFEIHGTKHIGLATGDHTVIL